MTRTKKFSQGEVIKKVTVNLPTKGICFRLTFKWAATMLVGGAFNYTPNPNKTATKHTAYRTNTLANEALRQGDFSDNAHFEEYSGIDWVETRKFVNQWGLEFTDANKQKFHGVYVEDQSIEPIWAYLSTRAQLGTAAVLGVFYGRAGGKAWGHVVAYCTHGGPNQGGPCFFDANSGVWEFGMEQPADAIRAYVRTYYRTNDRTLENFNTIVLKQR